MPETSSPTGPGSGVREATCGQTRAASRSAKTWPGPGDAEHAGIPAEHQPGPVRQGLDAAAAAVSASSCGASQHGQQVEGQRAVLVPPRALRAGEQPGDGATGAGASGSLAGRRRGRASRSRPSRCGVGGAGAQPQRARPPRPAPRARRGPPRRRCGRPGRGRRPRGSAPRRRRTARPQRRPPTRRSVRGPRRSPPSVAGRRSVLPAAKVLMSRARPSARLSSARA